MIIIGVMLANRQIINVLNKKRYLKIEKKTIIALAIFSDHSIQKNIGIKT